MPQPVDTSYLADAFLDQIEMTECGPHKIVRSIDPADEMFAYLARQPKLAHRAPFEYFRSGYEAFRVAKYVAALAGRPLKSVDSMLDFACGRGRVARYFAREIGGEFWASDIDVNGLQFVADTFGARTVVSTRDPKEIQFPRTFDVIFVGSLFSHLPRNSFVSWLRTLRDALSPGGVLIFSTHGPRHLGASERDSTGFTFVPESETMRLDSTDYGSAYVECNVVSQLAIEAGLSAPHCAPDDLWSSQDLHVTWRSDFDGPADAFKDWTATPLPRGSVDRLDRPREGWIWIGGGVRGSGRGSARPECRVDEVRLLVKGLPPVAARLSEPGSDDLRDWYTEGDASALAGAPHAVLVEVRTASGERTIVDAVALTEVD